MGRFSGSKVKLDLGCGRWKRCNDFIPYTLGGKPFNFWNRAYEKIFGYEPEVVSFAREHAPYDTAVDVGAGWGYLTRQFAKISKRVIAIEPFNLETDGMPSNVEVHKVAVSDKRGTGRLEWRNLAEVVEFVLLDDIVCKADFLKFDIDANEVETLRASSILSSVRACSIEYNAETQKELEELVEKAGLRIVRRMPFGKPPLVTRILLQIGDNSQSSTGYGNMLCLRS